MRPNLIISAGGTGGHIFPALAVASQLNDKFNIIWVGATVGLENQIVPRHGYKLETVRIGGIRNKGLVRKLMLPITLFKAFVSCLYLILKYQPKAVIGFGGYSTFPICLMAKLTYRPVIIHEQNSVAGLTNKILSKISNRILTAFPGVLTSSKTFMVGNPVRDEIILVGQHKFQSAEDSTANGLRILIIGGSLGAKVLNDFAPLALARSSQKILSVVHQVGRGDASVVAELYQEYKLNAKVVNFIDDMAEAYANADLVICRAGASTVAEIACAGVAAIFVPYPYAVDDHQASNARYLADNNAAFLLPQSDLSVESLAEVINKWDIIKCREVGNKAKSFAIVDSTTQICNHILELI